MVVCVNNLGALSVLEMAVITRAAIICLGNDALSHFIKVDLTQISILHKCSILLCICAHMATESRGIEVSGVMCGSFMTSLEMAGVSLSLMRAEQNTLRLFGEYLHTQNW